MSTAAQVTALAAPALAELGSLAVAVQGLASEMIVGPGGVALIALGVLGVAILAVDVVRLGVRLVRRVAGRRADAPCAATRAAQARALAAAGATLPEIAQRTGLARDALTLIVCGTAEPHPAPTGPVLDDAQGIGAQPHAAAPRFAAQLSAAPAPARSQLRPGLVSSAAAVSLPRSPFRRRVGFGTAV